MLYTFKKNKFMKKIDKIDKLVFWYIILIIIFGFVVLYANPVLSDKTKFLKLECIKCHSVLKDSIYSKSKTPIDLSNIDTLKGLGFYADYLACVDSLNGKLHPIKITIQESTIEISDWLFEIAGKK